MPIDRKLLEILRCPVTKLQVIPLTVTQLETINERISGGNVFFADGTVVKSPLKEGLVTDNSVRIYRVEQDIPVMLEDESILTDQFEKF